MSDKYQARLRDICYKRQWTLPRYLVTSCHAGFYCSVTVAAQVYSGRWAETEEEARENSAEKAVKSIQVEYGQR
ncbi:hypothetical protein OnM2_015066 [Erysiphe neolycopersici]|uniref:DRBM domain-containing protein n=1 Tax=Erysiphe neolycopersici TaxID=212602 RepID=A0A420I5F1_9PEZI|nr:hypothetical protein OnM2_015066 [Erysiphe neolycopersici]